MAKTDGVPLFVEELSKMVLESGFLQEQEERYALTGPLPPLAIPSTLHDSLMARLDRLATVKAIAQLGATLGREFSSALLQAVSPWDEGTVQRGLQQLVEAEFLYQQGVQPHATYRFKHALIQDTAYQSLLKSTRQQYHQRIAQVLEAQFPDIAETQPELVAHHYTEAGLGRQALPTGNGPGSAPSHVRRMSKRWDTSRGAGVLASLPDTPERTPHELGLQTALGGLDGDQGLCGPGGGTRLCPGPGALPAGGDTPQLFAVLWGLWDFYFARAELQTARELGAQLPPPGPAPPRPSDSSCRHTGRWG